METSSCRPSVGMILGKFLPPHAGHQYLVHFGQNFVDRLYVLVCSIQAEPIDGRLRYAWMRELFPNVTIIHIDAELPQEPADHLHFWDIWRDTVQTAVPEPINVVFASEQYGVRLAVELGATYVPVDQARGQVPISGTAIRRDPFAHWRFIPECVRPYYVKRVCLFGPESTGKSTLARDLAQHFDTVYVPEFARSWLDPKQGVCVADDIPIIARGQRASEDALARQANRLLFCDTDMLLTTVWSDVLFGSCPEWIVQSAAHRHYDLYLLMDVDVPWVDDAQRYLPNQRHEFFDRCQTVLQQSGRCMVVISGSWQERFTQACVAVNALFD